MINVQDDKGYNQGFVDSYTMQIRSQRRVDYIISLMNNEEGKDVLEIGCGRGEISNYIASKTKNFILGTDICVPFVEIAKTRYNQDNLKFEVLDFNQPEKIENRKFDYIIGNGILHHLYYNIDEALINIKTLLKPGGKLIFLEPNIYNPYCYLIFSTLPIFRKMAKLEPSEKAFSKKFISKKLKSIQFIEIEVEYKDFLLPIIPKFLIKFVVKIGNILEKIPIIKLTTQSIFISATKPS